MLVFECVRVVMSECVNVVMLDGGVNLRHFADPTHIPGQASAGAAR